MKSRRAGRDLHGGLPDHYFNDRYPTGLDMKSVFNGVFLASLLHREYTLSEKIALWRGKLFSGSRLWNTQLSTDLTRKVTRLGGGAVPGLADRDRSAGVAALRL